MKARFKVVLEWTEDVHDYYILEDEHQQFIGERPGTKKFVDALRRDFERSFPHTIPDYCKKRIAIKRVM